MQASSFSVLFELLYIVVVDKGRYVMETKKYIIIGSGAAGVSAAEEIRKNDSEALIQIISRDTVIPYNRPKLTKSINDLDLCADKIAIHPADWYREQNIELTLDTEIVHIDSDKKQVTDRNGRTYTYDRLILATGASCFVPPIQGSDTEGVVTIRTIEDVKKIQSALADKQRVLLIGGGVLGLEAAWGFLQLKKEVTILEAMPRLMPRQLDEEASEVLKNLVESKGAAIHTGIKIEKIEKENDGLHVSTDQGMFICDLAVVSAGVRASVSLAKEAGIAVDRSIVIDEKAQTSIPDIYACGDCAEFQGVNYSLWSQALNEGMAAGRNASGVPYAYANSAAALTFFGMGTMLYALGDIGSDSTKIYKLLDMSIPEKSICRRFYFKDDRLCGVILIGNLTGWKELSAMLKTASIEEVRNQFAS